MAQTLTLCSVRLPRIPSSPRHLNKGLVVIGWRTCVWELPVWLALAPLRYRCWSLGSAAVTYPDIRLGWLLPVSSSLLIWDYIPCVLSIYGMNWVPPSMLTFLPELSFDNIIRKNCSLEYPDHKSGEEGEDCDDDHGDDMDRFDEGVLHHPVRVGWVIKGEPDSMTDDGKEPEKHKAQDHSQPLWPNPGVSVYGAREEDDKDECHHLSSTKLPDPHLLWLIGKMSHPVEYDALINGVQEGNEKTKTSILLQKKNNLIISKLNHLCHTLGK